MHLALAEEIEIARKCTEHSEESWKDQLERACFNSFLRVDAGSEPIAPETAGSTAVVAIVCPSYIVVANCGDSRAVLCRGRSPVTLSVDHKVSSLLCIVAVIFGTLKCLKF